MHVHVYPMKYISFDRVVFPHRKRTVKKGEIIQKRYILGIEEYQFGPLHCSKPRDRYREGRYPENMERITISNPGQMTSDVSFCFQKDVNASTFLYEPPSMTLQTGESQVSQCMYWLRTLG